jgi:hypothetical protein
MKKPQNPQKMRPTVLMEPAPLNTCVTQSKELTCVRYQRFMPSYLEGRDDKGHSSKPAQENSSGEPALKTSNTKQGW